MSKYEERAFRVGKTKPGLAEMKSQLSRLKEDLSQFVARKPGGAVVAPLRQRIVALEAEIAAIEQDRMRQKQAERDVEESANDDRPSGTRIAPRFPPRRR